VFVLSDSIKDAQFEAIKSELQKLGYVRPGSLVRRFTSCCNPACRCMADPPQLHGPYYQWSYKIAGRTKTVRLSAEQASVCKDWIENHKRFRTIIRKLEKLSLEKTDNILATISSP